ncbi:MAG: 2-oxoglutarate and iron-dependent oxygenase domain-containing protein [Rhodomicrobium sp.]
MTADPFAIPIIDISGFLHREDAERERIARAFGEAFEQVGFATITGHGIDSKLIEETYAAMREFFALPLGEKLKSTPPEKAKSRGYLPVGIESVAATLSGETPPDLCEALVFYGLARPHASDAKPIIWPERPPAIRELVPRYHEALKRLGQQLVRLASLALNLPETFLDPFFEDPGIVLRFVNYPDQHDPPAPGQLRYGAHHDYGGLTILRQDDAPGGLEVRDRKGVWHPVPPSPDGFVINIGDLMSRWTNRRWRSTLHRVVNPGRELSGTAQRLSMVTFFSPNEQSEIACLPSCVTPEKPPRWPPVKAGDYIRDKIMKSMDIASAEAT